MKRSRMKRKSTKRGKEAQRVIDEFRAQYCAPGKRCWLCETEQATEIHHIVRRRGDIYDDRRNLLAVSWLSHQRLHHGPQTIFSGRVLPAWTDKDVERAKRRWDPDNWDPAYLDYLRHPEKYLREHGTMIYQEKDR
jgi:hypothetical protein